MNKDKINIRKLYKTYKSGTKDLEVLKGITLSVKDNEFLTVQGPSGAGKSTLLHIVGGLERPDSGEVIFEDLNVYKLNEGARAVLRNKKVGFVFQFYHLLPELNTLDNVLLPVILKSWRESKKAVSFAKDLLNELGLSNRLLHRPAELSGGEQQRTAIARALINKPQVLLCDEPTGNLDSENGKNILNLLKNLNKKDKLTILMVTHDKDIAENSDRVIYLKDGVIVN
jgi:lipoprotein-releasing system ATP-binding protein